MKILGASLPSQRIHDDINLRALWRKVVDRLCCQHKLTLALAACLCLAAPTYAFNEPTFNEPTFNKQNLGAQPLVSITRNIKLSDTKDSTIDLLISESSAYDEPSLYAVLDAEFSADRGDMPRALAIYKQQAFKENATAVFERALSLSLRGEGFESSLAFASAWQALNPDHVPAWFYVAHLALKAHDYSLAAQTLTLILQDDPRADLSEVLIGIYPETDDDRRELLAALQLIDSDQNASLSVLKAGLLLQFDDYEMALRQINHSLARQPDYVPFITLKADILRKLESSDTVISYLSQARLRNPFNKSLYLYEIRYLLDLNQSSEAWQLLLEANKRFDDDAEITLLATLVSLDIEEYSSADRLLNQLAKSASYLDQAYYYLGISAERQQRFDQAKYYLNGVMQEDLVLAARKKVVAFELNDNNIEAAITTLEKLRQQFEIYAPEAYILQADILWQQDQKDATLALLSRASREHPDNEDLLFARVQLLDDRSDYIVKRTLLNHLQALYPDNLSYTLSYARLLLVNDRLSGQGLALAQAVVQIRYDDPRYDNDMHLQALNLLADNALANDDYAQVISYLQTPYDVLPTLQSGVLLLRAYQGLGDDKKVEMLLDDLQQRFSFGEQNINDRIQLY